MHTDPPKSSLAGVVLNFLKFTKNYTKTFTFCTSIISLPGKTKHLKTSGTQIFVNEQGTLGPGALYKLRYIFEIVTIIMSFCPFRLCYFELHFNLNSHGCISLKPLEPVHSN